MKKIIFIALISIFCCIYSSAKEPTRGYRGFVEANAELGWLDKYSDNSTVYCLYGISTSHGYQFNPHFFLGGGLWIQAAAGDVMRRIELPIFIHGRTDWTLGKVPVFADLRIGGTLSARTLDYGDDKFLIATAVGYRLDWGKSTCANFAIGVSMHGFDDGHGRIHCTWRPLPSVRIGIEF